MEGPLYMITILHSCGLLRPQTRAPNQVKLPLPNLLLIQKQRVSGDGDGQLTRKEKLMLELQTIEQKLSSRSQSRKTKLLSELKAIDRAIEKKSKKLSQH